MLAEKNKNLKNLPKASSSALPHLPLKCTVSRSANTHTRTHCKETAASINKQKPKPALHTNVTAHEQDKTVKKGPASACSQAQSLHRSTSIKTDLQKSLLVTGVENTAHKSQVKGPTRYRLLANSVLSCADATKQATVTLKTTKESKTHTDLKKPLNRYPPAKPERTGKTQTASQDTQVTNKLRSKQGPTHTQRSVPVPARQRSSLMTTFAKTENASKSSSAPVSGVTKAAPCQQQRHTTFKLPSKPTVQAPGPQTLKRPTKMSSLSRGPEQPKTPKSTFNPGTRGVRTVPLDARNKPTTAQEERM